MINVTFVFLNLINNQLTYYFYYNHVRTMLPLGEKKKSRTKYKAE